MNKVNHSIHLEDYSLTIVTGATGWLGRRVVRALTSGQPELGAMGSGGHRVRCLVSSTETFADLLDLGVEITFGDLRDPEAVNDLMSNAAGALVLHLAGVIHPRKRIREFTEVNVDGAANLLRAARHAGARRIVAISSNSAFGANPTPDHRFTEDSPFNPYMGYGRSKQKLEVLLQAAMACSGDPEIVIARAPWFYGPGQPPRQTQFFTMIKEGKFPILGQGANRRSMAFVDSLTLCLLLCATVARAAGRTYWLADERPYAMTEIADTVRAVLREDFGLTVSDRILRMPSVVADIARLVDGGVQSFGFYNQKFHVLSEMNQTIACDISRAKEELGYRPLVELREGMRRSVKWCLENGLTI
jgi:nucleoside-diphosphate-sugar epimerase